MYNQYIQYFETLVSNHADFGTNQSENHFIRGGMDELVKGIKEPSYKDPYFVIEDPDVKIKQHSGIVSARAEVGFFIVTPFDGDGHDKLQSLRHKTLEWCRHYLSMMYMDRKRKVNPIYTWDIDTTQLIRFDNISGLVGWYCHFEYQHLNWIDSCDLSKFGDYANIS